MNPGRAAHAQTPSHEPARMPRARASADVAGQLAGGVAHDFNNMLTAILGFVDLLSMRSDLPDDAREDLDEIGKAARMAASLSGRLLAFSRRSRNDPQIIDLNRVVSKLAPRLRAVLGEAIALDVALAPGLHRVYADAAQLEHAIVQLTLNARQAMCASGRVTLSTANHAVAGDDGSGPQAGVAGPHVMLAIADTGAGMDAATTATLLQAPFTAGSRGKGIGLGLATVLGIVEASRGSMAVRSVPGEGTTFTICLPVCDVAEPAHAPVEAVSHATAGPSRDGAPG